MMRRTWVRRRFPSAATIESAGAEIDLGFLARPTLNSSERQLLLRIEPADEPAHAVVAAREAILRDEILVDPLGAQANFELANNHRAKRLTFAGATRVFHDFGADGRFGWVCLDVTSFRADGRFGWVWIRIYGLGADGHFGRVYIR